MQTKFKNVVHHYVENLKHSKEAKSYLHDRHLTDSTIKRFEIGLAKSNTIEVNNKHVRKLGLVDIYNNKEKAFYHDRVMIPIKDNDGEYAGFTARTLYNINPKYQTDKQRKDNRHYKNTMKYKNSRDSEIFDKSKILFNLHALNGNKNVISVIIMEAQLNTVAFTQYQEHTKIDTPHPVSIGGKSLTDEHVNQLKQRGVINVFLAFDGDSAGRTGTLKAIEKLKDDFMVWVVIMPKGMDMMDMLPDYEAIEKIVFYSSITYTDWVSRYLLTLTKEKKRLEHLVTTIKDKKRLMPKKSRLTLVEGLHDVANNLQIEHYVNEFCRRKGIIEMRKMKHFVTGDDLSFKSIRELREFLQKQNPTALKHYIEEIKELNPKLVIKEMGEKLTISKI